MTYAPQSLKDDRAWLIDTLDMHPGSSSYPADLDPAEVGIVGSTAHVKTGTSYHLGKSQLKAGAYSAVTTRDRAGLTDAASALDVGQFAYSAGGRTWTQRDLAVWCVAQCRDAARDALDIREIIYSPDGKTVWRWDQQRGQASAPTLGGDLSHLTHDHFSRYRDAETRPLRPLFQRWLAHITGGGPNVQQEETMRYKFSGLPETPSGHDGRIHVTDGLRYRVIGLSGQVDSLMASAGAGPIITVTPANVPAGWTYKRAVDQLCGMPDAELAGGGEGGGTPQDLDEAVRRQLDRTRLAPL